MAPTLRVRIAPELRLFVAPRHRGGVAEVAYDGTATLGHIAESLGVPLTEVGTLLVDDVPRTPPHQPRAGTTIEIRPVERPQAAPPRFLPAFDNAVLGYDDRTRVIDDAHKHLSVAGARYLLVDGRVAATWTTAADGGRLVLGVRSLGAPVRSPEVEDEAERLLALLVPPGGTGVLDWS